MKSPGEMSSPLLCHGRVVRLKDMQPRRAEWLLYREQYGYNPTFDHNVGCIGTVVLSVSPLTDSTGRGRSNSAYFLSIFIQTGRRQWVNETKGFARLCP